MSTKSRQVTFGSRMIGAKIHAEGARERAKQAIREADRAEAELWSIRMEGYGGPAPPSPTNAQSLKGGLRAGGGQITPPWDRGRQAASTTDGAAASATPA